MDVHEVLVAARNRLDRDGWHQGGWGSDGGARCALGAVRDRATEETWAQRLAVQLNAWEALCAALGVKWDIKTDEIHPVAAWNDTPGRTKAEVLALFDKAIAQTAPEPADPLAGVTVEAETVEA